MALEGSQPFRLARELAAIIIAFGTILGAGGWLLAPHAKEFVIKAVDSKVKQLEAEIRANTNLLKQSNRDAAQARKDVEQIKKQNEILIDLLRQRSND